MTAALRSKARRATFYVPAVLLAVLALPIRGAAQGVPFVNTPVTTFDTCPQLQLPSVDEAARAAAQRLRDEAAALTLAGDARGARERLVRATELDPADPDLAYRLARAHEELGDALAARGSYCRYRALARSERDVAEAEARLRALSAAAVLQARAVLRAGRREPLTVLAAGIVPGGAQIATGRPTTGAIVAAIAIAGVALAADSRAVQRERHYTDPFGNVYSELVTTNTHPRRTLGISVSVAAIVGGAVEGFIRAAAGRRELLRRQSDTRAALRGAVVGAIEPR